jgi:hypothetical protein
VNDGWYPPRHQTALGDAEAVELAGRILAELVIDAAASPDELKAVIEENLAVLEWIGATAPAIRDRLRERYRTRRAELVAAAT